MIDPFVWGLMIFYVFYPFSQTMFVCYWPGRFKKKENIVKKRELQVPAFSPFATMFITYLLLVSSNILFIYNPGMIALKSRGGGGENAGNHYSSSSYTVFVYPTWKFSLPEIITFSKINFIVCFQFGQMQNFVVK